MNLLTDRFSLTLYHKWFDKNHLCPPFISESLGGVFAGFNHFHLLWFFALCITKESVTNLTSILASDHQFPNES